MEDCTPRITASHSAEESEGGMFGIATSSLLWVVPLAILALGVFLMVAKQRGVVLAALVSLLPAVVLIGGLRFLQQCGPIGFLEDHVANAVHGGNASPPPKARDHQPPLFSPFPDAYLAEGILVFGGIEGYVARGFNIEIPDLRNASFADRNRAQQVWSAALRLLPENWSLQVREFDDESGFAPRLLEYAQKTASCTDPAVRRLRNANFVGLSTSLERGQLRHRRLTLFVGYRLPPGTKNSARQLEMADGEFRQWEQTLQQLLGRLGARATAMSDADLIRQWADAFNPSYRALRDFDPAKQFDASSSLLQNVWHSELRGQGSQGFILDGFHHLAFTVKRLPAETYLTMLHSLASMPFSGVTVTAQIRRLPKDPLLKRAQAKVERIHRQRLEKPDEKLAVAQAQLEDKIRRLTADGVAPLELELIVVVRAPSLDELRDRAAAAKAAIHRMNGAQAFEATLASSSRSLFAKSLPGWMWSGHLGYRHYAEDPTVADLLPLVASFSGHPAPLECLFPGADGGLVNVVNFLGEGSAETPQNLVVLGAAGVGKSRVVTKVLLETAADIGFTAIIENGLSQEPFTRALGSEPLVFKAGGKQTLNLLDTNQLPRFPFWISTAAALTTRMMGIPKDEDKARRQHALVSRELMRLTTEHADDCLRHWPAERREGLLRESAALAERIRQNPQPLLDSFLEFREFQATHPAEAKIELSRFTEVELREHEHRCAAQVHDLVFAHLGAEEQLTLSSLRESLELSDDEECRWLAVLLVPWCEGGMFGRLFDGPTNVPLSQRVLHYELGFIPQGSKDLESIVAFGALNSLRDQCLGLPKRMRKRVVIDEVSRFLDVPGGEAILRELFESFRKHNTQVIIIGQQYSRIADSAIRPAIMGNTRAWFIFNTGDTQDIARLCSDLGLSPVTQELIRHFPRPDQMTGQKYSEFLYFHTDARQPICGTIRYHLLPCDGVDPKP